jgi:tetratricopeptide (TPR) repeat protein
MGIVYLAEQQEPVRRQVALKILKPGMDSQQVLVRFEAEQQTLAMMEHPHIARVYDAGLAPSGRPYFVMEHVQGIPITRHCDEHRLTIEERLHLFVHVCEAIQYAHQKGIIHRDIKPSNILVSVTDDRAVPKIIDFGIAKALTTSLTERTLYTEQSQFVGTPEYMSPEQAETTAQGVDTRTDVYSLGVVLYELLAGVLPFDPEALREGGAEHLRRVIREEDPKTPSTRLRSISGETSTKLAQQRRTDVRALGRRLRGDLDWITLKAMAKEPSRRYATAHALAEDIQRRLQHEPVSAAPPGALYRAGKLVRRHRQALAVTGTFLALGLVLLWAVPARVRAKALEHERILHEARKLFDTRGMQPEGASDPSDEALAKLEPLLASRHVGPEAQLLSATILVEHRHYEDAMPKLEKLRDARPEIGGAAYAQLARIIWESPSLGPEEVKKVEEYRKKAGALLPRTADAYYLRAMGAPTIRERLDLLAQALSLDWQNYEARRLLALTYYASRKYELLREEAFLLTNLRPTDPLAWSLHAAACQGLGSNDEAIQSYDRALRLVPQNDPQYTDLNAWRCEVLMRLGQYERVLDDARECLKIAPDAAILQSYLFCALTALGKYEEAGALFRRVVDAESAAAPPWRGWYPDTRLKNWSMKYVLDALAAGRPWHPPAREPGGPAFLHMLEAEDMHRNLAAKAHRLIGDCFPGRWSPDGTKVVFSLNALGSIGVAVYDLRTCRTDLLIVPGHDPSWSPDGRYIAFARDWSILRRSEVAGPERRYPHRPPVDEEVWVMKADGTEPRRLAMTAGWPSWSADSRHVYCRSWIEGLMSVSIEEIPPQPRPVIQSTCDTYAVSPDGAHVAHTELSSFHVTNLASRRRVADWAVPLTVWPRDWSPDGREISLGGAVAAGAPTGLWIYDFEQREAAQVLDGYVTTAFWSPDKTQLLLGVEAPYREIWVADLDPNRSTLEALGPGRDPDKDYRARIERCTRELEIDPNLINSHWERVTAALWLDDGSAPRYLQEFERVLDRVRVHPYFCDQLATAVLPCPELRDRLGPLALLAARKAIEKERGYARALAPLFDAAGQPEEAARLWKIGNTRGNFLVNGGFEDGVQYPWETNGNVNLEVVTELRGAAVAERPVQGQYCLYADVAPGNVYYYLAAICPVGAVFEAGKKYTVSAFLKARKGTLNVDFKPEQNRPPWPEYGERRMTITDTWAEYHVTTPVFNRNVVPAHFAFLVGAAPGGFWIDDVRFYEGNYVPTVVRK